MREAINISDFNYDLPSERIAKFPLDRRDDSKLLVYRGGEIQESVFKNIFNFIESGTVVAFNNTKVVRARLIFFKDTGARIEIFCLEPCEPADYERAFAAHGTCKWHCMVGNAKKFNCEVRIEYCGGVLRANKQEGDVVGFEWDSEHTFGELLELLGRVPIPPYFCRDSQEIDNERYQTTYAKNEGSVAAPTAGLHFTPDMLSKIEHRAEVTLHVGAGTFLPVKEEDATKHQMHVEFFDVTIEELEHLANNQGNIIAVGTTTVRTLESLAAMGQRIINTGTTDFGQPIGQWEAYQSEPCGNELRILANYMRKHALQRVIGSTQIMITPGYKFRTIKGLVTNFHQPKSTLLLLISAIVGEEWKKLYAYAMEHDFRFLSYGDSSLLMLPKTK